MTRGFAIPCGQDKCDELAAYRYTWPGHHEQMICDACTAKLRAVAYAIGITVTLIPLTPDDRAGLETES